MPWTSVDDVRMNFLERQEEITTASGSHIYIHRNDIEDVPSLYKNGSTLTQVGSSPASGEYKVERPGTIVLGTDATTSDRYVAYIHTHVSDDEIETQLDEVHFMIKSKIATEYDTPFVGDPPQLKRIERWCTQWAVLSQLDLSSVSGVSDDDMEEARTRYQDAKEQLKSILDGDQELLDSNGDAIGRASISTDDEAWVTHHSSAEGNDLF